MDQKQFPDLPLGFGMALMQKPEARKNFDSLSGQAQAGVVKYIQSSATGADAKNRIKTAISSLEKGQSTFF